MEKGILPEWEGRISTIDLLVQYLSEGEGCTVGLPIQLHNYPWARESFLRGRISTVDILVQHHNYLWTRESLLSKRISTIDLLVQR